jgi:hypothetical protein
MEAHDGSIALYHDNSPTTFILTFPQYLTHRPPTGSFWTEVQ